MAERLRPTLPRWAVCASWSACLPWCRHEYPASPTPAATDALVLVVEDEPRLAAVLCDYLRASGYRCEWIADGAKVMSAYAQRQRPPATRQQPSTNPGYRPRYLGSAVLRTADAGGCTGNRRHRKTDSA